MHYLAEIGYWYIFLLQTSKQSGSDADLVKKKAFVADETISQVFF